MRMRKAKPYRIIENWNGEPHITKDIETWREVEAIVLHDIRNHPYIEILVVDRNNKPWFAHSSKSLKECYNKYKKYLK